MEFTVTTTLPDFDYSSKINPSSLMIKVPSLTFRWIFWHYIDFSLLMFYYRYNLDYVDAIVDDIDRKIVHLLVQQGRLSHEQIGRIVNLARPTVHERVKRLELEGIIRGYHAHVDWGALGYPLTAFIWVSSRSKSDDTAMALLQLGSSEAIIESCHGVTGEWCILVQVHVSSPTALKEFIDRIYSVEGVQNTMTILSLTAYHKQMTMNSISIE